MNLLMTVPARFLVGANACDNNPGTYEGDGALELTFSGPCAIDKCGSLAKAMLSIDKKKSSDVGAEHSMT